MTRAPDLSSDDAEGAAAALYITFPTLSSVEVGDAARQAGVGDRMSNLKPQITFCSLPGLEPPSPTSHPVPSLPLSLEGPLAAYTRPRDRVKRSLSIRPWSTRLPFTRQIPICMDQWSAPWEISVQIQRSILREMEGIQFNVGPETWEERAELQLVRLQKSMFSARLGGVRYWDGVPGVLPSFQIHPHTRYPIHYFDFLCFDFVN
jgi:hypothetical protein